MTPAVYDFKVVRGASGPTEGLIFKLHANNNGEIENIPYEDVRLSIYNKRGTEKILRASLSEGSIVLLDAVDNSFAWVPTTTDTRLIPRGEGKAYYELEVWNGAYESVYMHGYITGIGGVNDDIDGTNSDGDS